MGVLDGQQVLGFGVASLLLIAVPGPSVLFVVGRTLAVGRRAALATVAGNAAGTYSLGVLVALGAGALLERFPAALGPVQVAGALVLCGLGVDAIRRRAALGELVAGSGGPAPLRALRQGYLVGVTNPKALVVFAVVMPPFLRPTDAPLPVQMLVLAVVPVTIGLLSDSAWALLSDLARRWLARSAGRLRALAVAGGCLMIGLGALLAIEALLP